MKKKLLAGAFLAVLLLGTAAMLGAGGSDPLISLSFLQGQFTSELDAERDRKLDQADASVRETVDKRIEAMKFADGAPGQGYVPSPTEAQLKKGDVLSGTTGLMVTHLGGTVRLDLSYGAVVDVTVGKEIPSGTELIPMHRYLVAEETAASFTVTSPTAVLNDQGNCDIARSQEQDYWSVARALRELTLFRGSDTGFGEGFDLHMAPTRAQGIIMFIRLMGEESEAMACTYSHPFTDVPKWMDHYVAWAYEKGYTNGVSPTKFGSTQTVSAEEYMEFLLRALGYSTAGVDDYLTSPDRALSLGILTEGEYHMLKDEPFLRAQAAYVSYYALDALSADGVTLAQKLMDKGIFTFQRLDAARNVIRSSRIN